MQKNFKMYPVRITLMTLLVFSYVPLLKAAVKSGNFRKKIEHIETSVDGSIGVFYMTGDGRAILSHRNNRRFPFCSAFKFLVAAAVLKQESEESLREKVRYQKKDLLPWSPETGKHPGRGMTVEALCQAAVGISDNTATNLLIRRLGGLKSVAKFARLTGDETFRLDRYEPDLNTALPGDPRDTSTPESMARSLGQIAFGHVLDQRQKKIFMNWMESSKTGINRIQAGLPAGWTAAGKTGTCGVFGTLNDIAVVRSPRGHSFILAVFVTRNQKPAPVEEKIIARVTKEVFSFWSEESGLL